MIYDSWGWETKWNITSTYMLYLQDQKSSPEIENHCHEAGKTSKIASSFWDNGVTKVWWQICLHYFLCLSSTPLIGNMLIDPCTSVDDKNSTEAIRMCGLFLSSLPRSLGSTCLNNSYNWAAQTVGREAGHREAFRQIRSQLSDIPRFQAVPRCRACRIPPWTAGRWLSREQPTSKWSLHTGSNREWFFKSWEVSTLSVYQAAWVRRWPTTAKICRIP